MFYGNDPRPGDNQEHPIKVEKDEYVVNRNAARKHRKLLDYINFVDEPRYDNKEMAHSSIDEAIALNALSGMQEGGVLPGYQSGDKVMAPEYKKYLAHGNDIMMTAHANPEDKTVFYQHEYQPFLYNRRGSLSGFVDKKGGKHFHTTDKLLEMADSLSSDDFDYRNIGRVENRYYDREGKRYGDFKFPGMVDIRRAEPQELNIEPVNYQNGGDVDFPVTGESIGAVDSLASYMSKFNKDIDFMGYGDEEAGILEQFGRPEFRRAGRTAQDEGFIMNEEEIGKALNYLAKRHQEKTLGMGAKGMQNGGSTYGYGSQVSTSPTFKDLYDYAGIEPSPEQRAKFEGNFKYDTSREEGTIADYMRGIETLQETGQGALRSAGVKSRAAGAGFGGFGKREEMQDLAGSVARGQYSSGLGRAQQDRFESIRGQRESWMTDAMAELGRLEELGGTDKLITPPGGTGPVGGGISGLTTGEILDPQDFTPVASLPTNNQGTVYFNGDFYVWSEQSGQYEIQ